MSMTPNQIRAMFDQRNQDFDRGNSAALAALYADDCILESPSYGLVRGRDAVEKVYQHWFRTFPDLHTEQPDLVISGNHVAQSEVVVGTDTGGFLGQAATGRPFRLFLVILCTLKDGKITHERRVYDIAGLTLQLTGTTEHDAAQIYRARLAGARLEHDLRIAAEIQQALLPERQHSRETFDVAMASIPCRAIGGDFCDHLDVSDHIFAMALGDVSGKGPPAALLAAQVQGILAGRLQSAGSAAQINAHLNQVLGRRVVESRFATMFLGLLSSDGLLTYSNAGHNPPLLLQAGSVRMLEKGGLVLGAFANVQYEEETIQLRQGDVLVVFSDGVTEAMNAQGDEFGDERLLSCIGAHRRLAPADQLNCLLKTVRTFTEGAPQSDDITAMVLKYGSPAP